MVPRQLSLDRRTDTYGPAAPAARVQPGTPAANEWPVGGAPPRLRHRARTDLSCRWTGRRRRPPRLRRRLPISPTPEAGRVVGDPDHAAAGASGEPPAGGVPRNDSPPGAG